MPDYDTRHKDGKEGIEISATGIARLLDDYLYSEGRMEIDGLSISDDKEDTLLLQVGDSTFEITVTEIDRKPDLTGAEL